MIFVVRSGRRLILQNKNILLISPEPWDHIFVSKHHYAIQLGRMGNRVYFLGPPAQSESLVSTEYENVVGLEYQGFPKGLRFYPGILQRQVIRKKFHTLERLAQARFDVIWSFDNSVFYDFAALPDDVLKISHIVDLNQDFQTGRAAATADICFCTTDLIKKRLLQYTKRCHKINHGFNDSSNDRVQISLPGDSPVKVLYAGNLAMPYIDWEILNFVVRDNPNVDFIFVGPNDDESRRAQQEVIRAKNAHMLGRLRPDDLLPYYKAADVLILAYQEKHHDDQANPHKMMEYLGSGKMIVATRTAEFRPLSDDGLLLMSNSNHEFPNRLREALDDLDHWNHETKMKLRMEWAENNTYHRQLMRIEKILSSSIMK